MSFSKRLVLWIVSLGSLLTLSISFLSWGVSQQVMQETTLELNQQVLRQVERNLRSLDLSIRNLGMSVFTNSDTQLLLSGRAEGPLLFERIQTLRNLEYSTIENNPLIHSVYLFSFDQNIHYQAPGLPLEPDREIQEQMRKILNQGQTLKPFLRSLPTDGGRKVLSYVLSSSLETSTGVPERGVVLNLYPSAVTEALDDRVFLFDQAFHLINEDGEPLPELKDAVHSMITSDNPGKTISRRKLAGTDYLVSVLHLDFLDWTLVLLKPSAEVFKRLADLQWLIVALTIFGLLLTVALSYSVARRLYQPLANLLLSLRKEIPDTEQDLQEADEFAFLQKLYHRKNHILPVEVAEGTTSGQVLAQYFLKKLTQDSSSLEPDDWKGAEAYGLSIDLHSPLQVVVLFQENAELVSEFPKGLLASFFAHPFEVVGWESDTTVMLCHPLDEATTPSLLSCLESFRAEANRQSLVFTIAVAENPVEAASTSLSVTTTLEALRFGRMLDKGTVLRADVIRNSRKHLLMVRTLREILQINFRDPSLNVEKLSTMMNLTAHYLAKIFRNVQGLSISDYLMELRLQEAAHLLLLPENNNIKEVMVTVGIENESTFYKGFKAKFGKTPREYVLEASIQQISKEAPLA